MQAEQIVGQRFVAELLSTFLSLWSTFFAPNKLENKNEGSMQASVELLFDELCGCHSW